MNPKYWLVALACSILLLPLLPEPNLGMVSTQATPDVYVGVDMAYGNSTTATAQAKELIDQVCGYTNLFIVGTGGISGHATVVNETFQYAYDKGLSFISLWPQNFDAPDDANLGAFMVQWFKNAKAAWGDKLLGFFCPSVDEPGGSQLDRAGGRLVKLETTQNSPDFDSNSTYVSNYIEATTIFESKIGDTLAGYSVLLNRTELPLFTSDYGLYWFDYKGGYDGILAELGLNHSNQLTVALCRGAAQVQNKQWGVIITYTGNDSSNFESGPELYDDMVYAYNAGAKYIVVFNSNENYTADILQQEHLTAMQQFWDYAKTHPRNATPASGRTALVLPYGYALGFRNPYDTLWGIWPQDVFPMNISAVVQNALAEYGDNLDIIYDEGLQPDNTMGYSQLVNWNDTSLAPTPSPSPTPNTTPSPTPTQTPPPDPLPTAYIVATAAVAVVAVFVGITLAFRKVQGQSNSP